LDIDGLYQHEVADAVEMTEIVLSTGHVEIISNVAENPDTEPAQIIDLDEAEEPTEESAEELTEEPTEEPTEESAEESAEEPTEELTEELTEEPTEEEPTEESTDAYSEMPHFPIALIVTELRPRA
jgi:predicted RNA-binding protein with RPS1 domain